jgi:hypothetical protein
LLALRGKSRPSLILFGQAHDRRPDRQAALLLVNLPSIEDPLQSGCVVVSDDARPHIRPLPVGGEEPANASASG